MIGIIDYGMGNLFSVAKALERLGADYFISGDPNELWKADGLILPGVGAFQDGMKALQEQGLVELIKSEADVEKPILGICLGMQLLFQESEENGLTEGLGLLQGRVVKFAGITEAGRRYKVPHMGWNHLSFQQPNSPLLKGIDPDFVYFVHSYYVVTEDAAILIASARYEDVVVPAVVGRGRLFGTQFHPEKSSGMGMAILKGFVELVKGADT